MRGYNLYLIWEFALAFVVLLSGRRGTWDFYFIFVAVRAFAFLLTVCL
jgi:hypothetical protein